MAKTPCARLTNPISPIVTDRPTEIRYRTIAKARPKNPILTAAERISLILSMIYGVVPERHYRVNGAGQATHGPRRDRRRIARRRRPPSRSVRDLFRRCVHFLPRILDHREGFEFDVGELAVDLLDPADIDILNDVAGQRIDHERSTWAVGGLVVLEDLHRLIAVELAVGLLDEVIDHRHAVPTLDGDEIGHVVGAVFLVPGGDERLVGRPRGGGRIAARTDHAERNVG